MKNDQPKGETLGRKWFKLALLPIFLLFFIHSVSAATPISNAAINLNVFIIIAAIAIVLLFLGLGANIPFFSIVGFFLIGVLGFVVQAGNLHVPTGDFEETYTYNATGTLTSTSIVKEFEPWNTGNYHFIGFFLMFTGWIAAFFNTFAVFGGGGD